MSVSRPLDLSLRKYGQQTCAHESAYLRELLLVAGANTTHSSPVDMQQDVRSTSSARS